MKAAILEALEKITVKDTTSRSAEKTRRSSR